MAKKKEVKKGSGSKKTSANTSTKSKTSTKTSTSTKAYTQGNITVTGGAGKGNTKVNIVTPAKKAKKR